MPLESYTLLCGRASRHLAAAVAAQLGLSLADVTLSRFADGEMRPALPGPLAGRGVILLQATPTAEDIMELLLLLDGCRRAGAAPIIAAIPYFGYARQDCRQGLEPLGAALLARLLETAGADRVVLLDLHNAAIEGFFRIPVIHLSPIPAFTDAWERQGLDLSSLVIAAPDAGGYKRAHAFAQALVGCDLALLHKVRAADGNCAVYGLAGQVRGRPVMLVDDILSTGGTLRAAARALADRGAAPIYAAVTHLLPTAPVSGLPENSILAGLFVTNSLALPTSALLSPVSVVSLLSHAIRQAAC